MLGENLKYILFYTGSNTLFSFDKKKIFEKKEHVFNYITEHDIIKFELYQGVKMKIEFTIKEEINVNKPQRTATN